ncbi:MAG: ABC-2 transporter permease [Oscillospiraceae bacterium]|nr:ABC-2 transporter permease [Oscillospiraceae bacterium]
MRNVLRKETRLSASVLSYLFILFGLTFFLPGYPVLIGVFFVTLGIFQSFQTAREANDVVFSVLLPIAKRDVVKGKYAFVCLIECAALLLMALAVVLRMTVFAQSAVYRANALMNANFFALGTACLIFGLFNWIFVGGFFKTAYRFAHPFVTYLVVAFPVILIAEALHHVPGLEALNAFGTDGLGLQLGLLAGGLAGFLLITVLSCKRACARFEAIDL